VTKQEKPALKVPGRYLGGHPTDDIAPEDGRLELNETAIYLFTYGARFPRRAIVPWTSVRSVYVEPSTEAKSRVGPVLAFGLLGLAAKGSAESSVVSVHLNDGGVVYYQAQARFMAFRAKIGPIIRGFGVSVTDVPPPSAVAPTPATSSPKSVADELSKLAQLRDSGVLTDDEFAAQKARLLS
jgi:hypothetical protein